MLFSIQNRESKKRRSSRSPDLHVAKSRAPHYTTVFHRFNRKWMRDFAKWSTLQCSAVHYYGNWKAIQTAKSNGEYRVRAAWPQRSLRRRSSQSDGSKIRAHFHSNERRAEQSSGEQSRAQHNCRPRAEQSSSSRRRNETCSSSTCAGHRRGSDASESQLGFGIRNFDY